MNTCIFINAVLDNIRSHVPEKANTYVNLNVIKKDEFEDSFDNDLEIILTAHYSTWRIDGIFSITFNDNLYYTSHNILEYDIATKVLLDFGLVKTYIRIVWKFLHNTNMAFRITRMTADIRMISLIGDISALNTLLFTDWEKLTEERFDETKMNRRYFERYYLIKTEQLNRVFRMKLCKNLNNDTISHECKAVMLRWLREHEETNGGDMEL